MCLRKLLAFFGQKAEFSGMLRSFGAGDPCRASFRKWIAAVRVSQQRHLELCPKQRLLRVFLSCCRLLCLPDCCFGEAFHSWAFPRLWCPGAWADVYHLLAFEQTHHLTQCKRLPPPPIFASVLS